MSGDSVPYHLRPNKFIERELFCELLGKLSKWKKLDSYLYASLGGAFLADAKLVNVRLGIKKLLSVESMPYIHTRQLFNMPVKGIRCEQMDSSRFVTNFDSWISDFKCTNAIVWLDFAKASPRQHQIREFGQLLRAMNTGDVAKITLNTSINTVYQRLKDQDTPAYQTQTFNKLKDDLGDLFIEGELDSSQMNNDGLAKALLLALEKVASDATNGDYRKKYMPLSVLRYSDGFHEMMTVTVVALNEKDMAGFFKKSKVKKWPFFSETWMKWHEIAVPELSIKERQRIDKLIKKHKSDALQVHTALGFKLASNDDESLGSLSSYIKHRAYSPYVFLSDSKTVPRAMKKHFSHFL
ncbi:MAG: hypothetical protein K8R48_01305 [Alphaproteobacteria bacterium]|nr:hypothetical protein [Alphaproteobacteria bacterium]